LMFLTGECLPGNNLLNRNKHPTIRILVHLSTYLQLQTAYSSWTVSGLQMYKSWCPKRISQVEHLQDG
jgi:hypothetical protein